MLIALAPAWATDDPLNILTPDEPELILPPYLPQVRPAAPIPSDNATSLRDHRVSRALRENTNRLRHQDRFTADRPFAFQYSRDNRPSSRLLNEGRVDRLGLPRSYLRR